MNVVTQRCVASLDLWGKLHTQYMPWHSNEKDIVWGGPYSSCLIFSLMLPLSVFTLTTGNSPGARCRVGAGWVLLGMISAWSCPSLTNHLLHNNQGLDLWQFGSRRQFSSAKSTLDLKGGRMGSKNRSEKCPASWHEQCSVHLTNLNIVLLFIYHYISTQKLSL